LQSRSQQNERARRSKQQLWQPAPQNERPKEKLDLARVWWKDDTLIKPVHDHCAE
jgi:hypothetical protein